MIRPVVSADMGWLPRVPYSGRSTLRWRPGGRTLGPDALHRLVWDQVLTQAVSMERDQPRALFQIHDESLQNGYAKFGMASPLPTLRSEECAADAQAFLASVFRDFPLRKLYVEVLEEDQELIDHLGLAAEVEGRLVGHERVAEGRFQDLLILSLSRPEPSIVGP